MSDFEKQWNTESVFDRWFFRGRVVGYIIAEIVLAVFTFGGATAAKLITKGLKYLGKAGKVIIEIIETIAKQSKKVKAPDIPSTKNKTETNNTKTPSSNNNKPNNGNKSKKNNKTIPKWKGKVDYSPVHNSKNPGAGKDFTTEHKKRLLEHNRKMNDGILRSDLDGTILDAPVQSKKGIPANMNQAEVDHIKAKSKGGWNTSENAQILSKKQNIKKSNN